MKIGHNIVNYRTGKGNRFLALVALSGGIGLGSLVGQPGAYAKERAAPPASARIPEEIVGQWQWGTIGMISYEDAHTGRNLGPGRGMVVFFTFDKYGKYKQFTAIQTRTNNWAIQTWTDEEGTVAFDGSMFTVQPTAGKYKSADNQVKKNNFERPMTREELKKGRKVYHWKWEKNANDGKTYLMIGPTEQSFSSFQKKK